ncbi:MAG: response regulator transcription factor [Bacillota bacterium]|nr:response regulator transcription factor [Bacillota bacterium]
MKNILIVEDDKGLREGMALALKREEFSFTLCGTLEEAEKYLAGRPDLELILLDLNLPDGSGYDFLQKVKRRSDIPIIIITANDMELDEVRGLELGADDYIVKPFSLMVLRARIDKVLKSAGKDEKKVYCFGDLFFSFGEMKFFRGEEEIVLSRTEQKLLWLLVENKNIVLTRDQLLDRIWTDGAEYVDENALSVAVNRLRTKLREGADGHLQTVYGKGYIWKCQKT